MKTTSKVAMAVLAATLSAPVAFAAQSTTATTAPTVGTSAVTPNNAVTPPATTGMTTSPATVMPRTTAMTTARPADNSTYMTADAHVRASKIVGAAVYNDQDQKIGSIDDVLMGNDGPSTVVLSVGGFLGMGSKLVEVPYSQISLANDKLMMTGASKESLTSLPEYKYTSKS